MTNVCNLPGLGLAGLLLVLFENDISALSLTVEPQPVGQAYHNAVLHADVAVTAKTVNPRCLTTPVMQSATLCQHSKPQGHSCSAMACFDADIAC